MLLPKRKGDETKAKTVSEAQARADERLQRIRERMATAAGVRPGDITIDARVIRVPRITIDKAAIHAAQAAREAARLERAEAETQERADRAERARERAAARAEREHTLQEERAERAAEREAARMVRTAAYMAAEEERER